MIGILPPGITPSLVGNELTLSGTASVAAYMAALGQIAFNNPGEAPDPGNRLILVSVDDDSATTNAFVLVQVQPVNDPPAAQDGSASGTEDAQVSGTLVATDVDSATLTYALGTQAAHGTVVVNADGSFTYTPNADFNGADSFTFLANDGEADSNIATVNLSIAALNDAPVAQDGSASGTEDAQVSGTLVATDVDSATLTYSLGTPAANGTVVVNTDGSYIYTPNADFNGADSFTFLANDGEADSNAATISLSIAALNDPPAAQDSSASGTEDTPVAGTLVATDVDSEGLTYRLGTPAAHGTAVVNPDGSYTYTPNPDFNGSDSFTFIANDTAADSNAATVSLSIAAVNDPPVLDLDADDSTSSGSDYATTFTEDGAAVTIADADIAISASTLVSATITLTNPLAGDLLSVSGALPGGVTAVYDPATGVMTLTGTAPAAAYQAASDQIVYSNSSDNPLTDDRIITVVVNDGIDDSNTATAVVTVAALNDAPVAQDGSASGSEDTPLSGTLVATDVDSEGLTYRLGTQAGHGTVVVNPDGTFTYTPAQNFNGTDGFTFLANDGAVDSNIATVNLTIAGANDAPLLDLDADDSAAASTYFVTTFTGANVPVSDTDVAIADSDSPTLTSATIHLLTPGSGDGLSVNGALPAGISASAYDPVTGILTLSGEASLADYQTAIHQVEFGTTDTSLTSRIIEITVNDGTLDSNTAVSTIDLEAPPSRQSRRP